VIITAYRNAAIAKPLVESLLKQRYENFIIYLVADECPDIDFGMQDSQFVYLRPDPPLHLKVKSIIHGIEHFKREHEYIAVFDADNLAHPDFLAEINRYANSGYLCIQGQRTAKNLDSDMSAADSFGEIYKNYIERYVPYMLGGSAVISGSGMATETHLYKAYLASPEIEQGKLQWKKMLQEDKILQNYLVRRNITIAWARQAICYDEKVTSADGVQTQRSRWLFSYFQNFPNVLGILRRGMLGLRFQQLYFGWVTGVLPMFLQLGVAALLIIAGLYFAPYMSLLLMGALAVFSTTIFWVLHLDEAPASVWKSVKALPVFVLRQFAGLFKMGNPNKNFKHTEHNKYISVDDLLKKKDQ
jgi:cellulose synthase/poly-beta-1,6-N-acetylglucosamine synthase-like glycosyltransferase